MAITALHATAVRDTPAGVLSALRESRAAARAAEVEVMVAAVAWADLHPVDSIGDAVMVPGTDRGLAIGGEGVPLVAEFAVAELAAALGRSADSARLWLGTVLEIRHRLPRIWARLVGGGLEPWRARQIASHTLSLGEAGAGWVDAQVVAVAHKIGPAQLERVILEAVRRFDPERAHADEVAAAEQRHVTIHDHRLAGSVTGGCVEVSATLDVVDARDLESAVAKTAHDLLLAGCEDALDVRRAQALGEIARHELTLDLGAGDAGSRPGSSTERDATIYVHVAAETLDVLEDETGAGRLVGVVEKIGAARDITVGLERLRSWLTRPTTGTTGFTVSIRPVIDLNATITSSGYQPSAVLREQVVLRNRVCVFPYCTRASRAADLDHIAPYAPDAPGGCGGATASENLAPLCRLHHRVKTHGGWSYAQFAPGEFLWRGPHGHGFVVDPTGTIALDDPARPAADDPAREPGCS
jgi:hypothetical protein